MAILNMQDEMNKVEQRLNEPEEMLGKGLMQPFSNTNSGARKIMFGTHLEHRLPLMNPEVPLIQTGYENEFGEYSSSFVPADRNYKVLSKISKFSFAPNHHYYLILLDEAKQELSIVERVSYRHITETYGYLMNNDIIDYLHEGDNIEKGTVLQKSQSFDDYNNRMDGVNLLTAYISCEKSMEDGILLSESAADKFISPLIKQVTIIINDNDIPLNLYGNNDIYKTFPDIGEEIKNGILCGIRREKKEESLFTQSYTRLQDIMMSDDKFTVEGKVMDINIYCNNPSNLDSSYYNSQLKRYYDENMRFNSEIVNLITPLLKIYTMNYDLQKVYYSARRILSGDQYIKDRPFSNIIMDIIVMEENKIQQGDKLSDRYGGKGVVSKILPDELMPQLNNGQRVDVCFNSSTCVNRENPGQLFEVSINHIGQHILDYISLQVLDLDQSLELYIQFVSSLSKDLGAYYENFIMQMDEDEKMAFINSVISDNGIMLSLKPISESLDLDMLNEIYQKFPWVKQSQISVPIFDSNGKMRMVPARRSIVVGRKYVYRLKQYAEEKFSVTSLSSTNIRNENSRSKANKSYKALYTKTPIKFGEMESGDLAHIGMEAVIINLMIHSASPHGRRLAEELLTGDPFNIDIKLDTESKNRNVEILNAYLKTMGLRLVFEKIYKDKITPVLIHPVDFPFEQSSKLIVPVYFPDKDEKFDPEYLMKIKEQENMDGLLIPVYFHPVQFPFGDDTNNSVEVLFNKDNKKRR